MALALSGVNVIDVSQGISGPLCALLLADLGADVIKVEPPDGDWLRDIGPFVNGESSLFIRLNRGKKGVCLDLKDERGKQAFRDLAKRADIVIEGYRTGVMDRLGMGYEALAADNPGLIYCSISGYGSEGPMAELPATELDMQAMVDSWRRLGVRTESPLRVGFDIYSSVAGWTALQSILVGLFVRENTGEGQHVETSMMHAGVALQSQNFIAESNPDQWKKDTLAGYLRPPERAFRCKDAYFLLDILVAEQQWREFCVAISAEDVLNDPRFATDHLRQDYRDDLRPMVSAHLQEWTFSAVEELIRTGNAAHPDFAQTIVRLQDADSLFADPTGQIAALELLHELQHPIVGSYRTLRLPWDFSEPITRLTETPAPAVGEHTVGVFEEVGYSRSQIEALLQSEPKGVVVAS